MTGLRIFLVGASGTLGKAVAAELGQRHEIIAAGRNAPIKIDITDPASIVAALKQAGPVDAVISAAGSVAFQPLSAIEPATIDNSVYGLGLRDKLMGQVNLALAARDVLKDGGSITLTTGILTTDIIAAGSAATMTNAAIEGFVRAAAAEMPRGIRINAVSPTVLTESMGDYGPFFRGFKPISAADAALGFSRSVEGIETGKVYRAE